jgi:putative nucleotidyltransferase with HDIG domain
VIAIRKKGPGVQPFTEAAARLLTTIGEMLGNSLQRMRLYHQALTRLRHLQALQTIDTTILSSMDQNLTLGIILNEVIRNTGVDAAAILLFDPVSFTLVYAAGQGFRTTFIQDTHLQLGKGHAGQVALERKVLHIDNLLEIQEPFDEQLVSKEGFVAYYAVPMITKGKVSGVLEVYHRSVLEMGSEMKNFLSALANQAAIAMDNAQLFNELQHTNLELVMAYDQTIEGWSRALDLRDKETEGHTQRVTDLTMRLARALGISGEPLIHIRRGALLHDIGKMGIPDHILLKPGELTEIEWEIMKKHPTYAYELLHPIYYLRPALDIPYCHHENWDGNGYPRGLKGEQIPLAARMFALADVWDALRSDRPYRPGWPEEKVREHIRALSGSYFDPEIARIFLRLVE